MKREDEIKEYCDALVAAFRPDRDFCRGCGYAMPLVNGTGLCADCVPSWVAPKNGFLTRRLAELAKEKNNGTSD